MSDSDTLSWITPDWPAPANVRALSTLRVGGASAGAYSSLNLATHVGDAPEVVAQNRTLLRKHARLPAEPVWLEQVHGTTVWDTQNEAAAPPAADAAVARTRQRICTIMTADCLPVLFCDLDGHAVGAAHAGWRGLVGGVLTETIRAMQVEGSRVLAWLGPAIEQGAFEVGDEVRAQFLARDARHARSFQRNARDRWQADLYALARAELAKLGVAGVYGGDFRVFREADRFFSYRRDKETGRMATMVWME